MTTTGRKSSTSCCSIIGRTDVLADEVGRPALHCIRCSACLNSCPVYSRVGGHAYESVYPGPIGAILTPQLRGLENAPTPPWASSSAAPARGLPVTSTSVRAPSPARTGCARPGAGGSREALRRRRRPRRLPETRRGGPETRAVGPRTIVMAALPGWSAMRGLPEAPEQPSASGRGATARRRRGDAISDGRGAALARVRAALARWPRSRRSCAPPASDRAGRPLDSSQ